MEGGPNIQESGGGSDVENAGCSCGRTCKNVCFQICHPSGKLHRFIALIFVCFLGFGSYFCYDNPAALQEKIEKDLNISVSQYTLLYSLYSWPNVVLCFVGGFLVDRVFGIRLGTNLYMGLTLIGQIIFSVAVYLNVFWLMLAGRFVFGIGAESLAVAQNNYAVLWFKGKELNMVFGLQLSFARIGSTVNFLVIDWIYDLVFKEYSGAHGLGIVLFIATSTCVFSMLCAIILGLLDKRAERILQRPNELSGDVVKLTDVKDFKVTFWILTVVCVTYYVAIFPFISLAKGFFMEKFDMKSDAANTLSSLVYLISGIASPILGFLIDKVGNNLSWIGIAVTSTILSHCLLAFTSIDPYVGMVIMGLAYSTLASSLWPLVSLIIPQYQLGTAYGVCQAVQNLGLAVIAIATGKIQEDYGYKWLEIFFIASLILAFIATILLWIADRFNHGVLNMTPGARLKHQQSILTAEALENEKLLSAEVGTSAESESLLPNSDFHIRNRYLSRIGAPLPSSYNINIKGLLYRPLR